MATDVKLSFSSSWVKDVTGLADPKIRAAAEAIAEYQRTHIPVSHDGSHGREPGYARSRIAVRVVFDPLAGRVYQVGSDATSPEGFPYPTVLDVGSSPHVIEAHGDYSLTDGHGHYFGRRVQHPGTKPTYWCRHSVTAIAGRTL